LIEKRLEKVVVGAVDECDFEAFVVGEAAGAFEAGESAADDEEFAGKGRHGNKVG
jgi:hypothetical protein